MHATLLHRDYKNCECFHLYEIQSSMGSESVTEVHLTADLGYRPEILLEDGGAVG